MTERLYYYEPYLREFDASVKRVDPDGTRRKVWLDRTTFYPTTGGQPFDTGTLGDSRVVDVFEDDGGDVVHVVEGPSPPGVGQPVHGVIDWHRRFDHMQQHTGQHVLSAAFVRLLNARTISFHLGADASTIDLSREVAPDEIARAEREANRIVWENRPVGIRYASAEEAAAMPLRKESKRTGTLRLIDVDDFDLSACGGTHVNRTGAVGIIAVSAWERFKGGQRVEFLCGGRALEHFHALRDVSVASVGLLSVLPTDVPSSIERLQADLRDQKRTIATLQNEIALHRAQALASGAEEHPRGRLVIGSIEGADANMLKALATAIASKPGFIALLVSTVTPALFVASRSADVEVSCQEIVASVTKQFGGRGGGKPDLAQAGGVIGPADSILSEARRSIS